MTNFHEYDRKALVSLAVEETLLEMNKMLFDKVSERLQKEYNCKLSDCLEYPEYLRIVLKDYSSDAYDVILNSIKEKLVEHEHKKSIQEFLTVMRR